MTHEYVINLGRETLMNAMVLAAPVLLVGLLVGILSAVVQAVTSVQEQTLSIIPKMLAVGIMLIVLMPWMLNRVLFFTRAALEGMGHLGG
jgi:flagellar biosynthetic protein FliQ